jgi:hypothetical protein
MLESRLSLRENTSNRMSQRPPDEKAPRFGLGWEKKFDWLQCLLKQYQTGTKFQAGMPEVDGAVQ